MFTKEAPVQKPVWRQFSFYCLAFVVAIVVLKKTVSLGVTPFLLLTALNYFLLGLLIGDLGWGFFSAHSKSLYLKTNWLLRIPVGIVNLVRGGDGDRNGSHGGSSSIHQQFSRDSSSNHPANHPVAFADMVGGAEPALLDDDPSGPATYTGSDDYAAARHAPASIPAHVQYASRRGSRAEEDSLLSRATQERHSLYPSVGESPSGRTSPAHNEAFLLASLDKPLPHGTPLTPDGNGSEVAHVLAQHQAQPRKMSPQGVAEDHRQDRAPHSSQPRDDMLSALMDAHGVSW